MDDVRTENFAVISPHVVAIKPETAPRPRTTQYGKKKCGIAKCIAVGFKTIGQADQHKNHVHHIPDSFPKVTLTAVIINTSARVNASGGISLKVAVIVMTY